MDERRINKAEFDAAVKSVMEKMIADPKFTGTSKLIVPLTGHMFADEMSKILFPEENENNDNA